ncbi:MAG: TonB-dependent receptor [Campylobacterales bacterium]|nr:TonB-dependent receptor [Campylobacterales bacterium]
MRRYFIGSLIASVALYANEVHFLDEIVTIGTKSEKSVSEQTTHVEVINSEEIENSGASNLSEVLNATPFVYVAPSGKTISIRGMGHSDTLLLIDGKRVNGEFAKTYELERIPAGMIERIEILKGSSSLLYGSDAMGGVINIITKKPSNEDVSGNVQVIGGKDKESVDTFVSGRVDKLSYTFYANYLNRDAYSKSKSTDVKVMQGGVEKSPSTLSGAGGWASLRSNLSNSYTISNDYTDNLETKNVGGSLAYDFGDFFRAYIEASYLKEKKDGLYVSESYATNYKNAGNTIMAKYIPAHQYDDNERFNIATGFDYHPSETLKLTYNLAYSRYEKDRKVYTPLWSELGYASKEASKSSLNVSTLEYLTNDAQLTWTLDQNNRIITGAEHRIHDATSTAYNVDDRTYTGAFVQHEYTPFEKLHFVYGVRYDRTSTHEEETSLSVGATYDLLERLKLRASYAQGFRSPDDRELYVNQTNPNGRKMLGATVIDTSAGKSSQYDLKSETSETFEIGFLTHGDSWMFDVAAFTTTIDDRISQVSYTTGGSNYNTFENISDSEIKGVEATFDVGLHENVWLQLGYTYQDAQNKTEHTKLSDVPKRIASLSLSYTPIKNLEFRSTTKYIGEQEGIDGEDVGGFSVTNVKVIARELFKNTDVFAGVDNVFEKRTPDYLGLLPEFAYYVGFNYKF